MPTKQQLEAESWWNREIVHSELRRLGDRMCATFNRPRSAAGDKGNEVHLRGAHRSQEWIKNSQYCTNRSYTVQSGLSSTQARWVAGFDFTPGNWGTAANRQLVAQITKRLIDAAKAGRLNGVIEIGGTLNGSSATGWHVTQSRVLNFDSSHLDHVHLTLDRTNVDSRTVMDNVFDVMTGGDMSWQEPLTAGADAGGGTFAAKDWLIGANWRATDAWENTELIKAELAALTELVKQLLAAGGSPDTVAILAGVEEKLAAQRQYIATTVEAQRKRIEDAVADLGEGGAAKVRAEIDGNQ